LSTIAILVVNGTISSLKRPPCSAAPTRRWHSSEY
jgi:hypothetical protein